MFSHEEMPNGSWKAARPRAPIGEGLRPLAELCLSGIRHCATGRDRCPAVCALPVLALTERSRSGRIGSLERDMRKQNDGRPSITQTSEPRHARDLPFQLEEATIAQLHEALRAGKTTLTQVVRRYIDRARAYNGVSSLLLTEDGAPVPV